MKRSIFIRALSVTLVALMLALTACSGGGTTDTTDTTAAPAYGDVTTAAPVETGPALDEYGREIVEADLPDTKYEGETFTVHMRGNVERYEWKADEVTGESLNDAIYERNKKIQEKYGITLNVIAEGSWADYASTNLPKVKASIMAQNGEYDLLAGFSSPFTSMATSGLLLNLNELEHLDFDKPWWWKNFIEEMEVDGISYFGLGALSLSAIYSMSATFFNPEIMEEVNPGVDVYQTVLDGNWTWDEMIKLSQNAYKELDGDNTLSAGDRYGVVLGNSANTNYQFLVSTGERWTGRDENGTPTINVNVEKMHAALDKLLKMYNETESVAFDAEANAHTRFMNGTALFTTSWLYYAQTKFAGEMEAYGVLPIPKYDAAQENYASWIQSGMHLYSIPIDVKDVERATILTEAFAAETYATLLPKYYEVILKNRYFADEASSKMMDIIYDSVQMDFGILYNGSIGMYDAFGSSLTSGNNTFSSSFATFKKVYEKKITQLLDAIRDAAQ